MKKILIAEDSVDQAKVLQLLLEKNGFLVDRVIDGKEALNLITNNTYDLFITDLMMPEITGYEILEHIQTQSIKLPVLVITSRQREEDVVKALNSGALDYITKPFSLALVLTKIKNILN